MIRSTAAKAWTKIVLKLFALAAVLALCVQVIPLFSADALTIENTTASSNQIAGNSIVGGLPTRLTWEAKVDQGEDVKSVTLIFPEGSSVTDDANSKATILYQEDPRVAATRIEVEQEFIISDTSTSITFVEPIEPGFSIRIEVYNLCLPVEGGEFVITGSYIDSEGVTHQLKDSRPITVIGFTTVEKIVAWLDGQPWVEAWNSVLFLRMFLNPQVIVAAVPNLFFGWLRSLGLVLVGFPLAIPIGLGFSFLRMAKLRPIRFLASIYVNVIRGTPLFLQIYIAFIGLPMLGISVAEYLLGIIVLAINSSAYLAEIFRAGIQSIHKGQFEASSSLGMNSAQTMFSVIIPQTVRRIIPTATSEFILLFKDTALLASVGVIEMMMFSKSMVATTAVMTPYIVAAGFYLIVTLPLTRLIAVFEARLAASEGTTKAPPPNKKKNKGATGVGEFFGVKLAPFDVVGTSENGAPPEALLSASLSPEELTQEAVPFVAAPLAPAASKTRFKLSPFHRKDTKE